MPEPARKPVLLAVPEPLLDRFDRFWRETGYASRRQAILASLEQTLAAHAASEARGRVQAADPSRWLPGPAQTSDRASDAGSAPHTAALMDL